MMIAQVSNTIYYNKDVTVIYVVGSTKNNKNSLRLKTEK